MKTLTHRSLLLTLALLGCPLLAVAHGGYGNGYYGPPAYGYQPRPVYPYGYVPRPHYARPYAYGYDRRNGGYYAPRHHGWREPRAYGGWRDGYGGGGFRGYGGGYPRGGFSFQFGN